MNILHRHKTLKLMISEQERAAFKAAAARRRLPVSVLARVAIKAYLMQLRRWRGA